MATIQLKNTTDQTVGNFDGSNNFTFYVSGRPYTISAARVAAEFDIVDRGLGPSNAIMSALRAGTATNAQVQLAIAKLWDLVG